MDTRPQIVSHAPGNRFSLERPTYGGKFQGSLKRRNVHRYFTHPLTARVQINSERHPVST